MKSLWEGPIADAGRGFRGAGSDVAEAPPHIGGTMRPAMAEKHEQTQRQTGTGHTSAFRTDAPTCKNWFHGSV